MGSVIFIPVPHNQILTSSYPVVVLFRRRGAINEKNAIQLSSVDYAEMGIGITDEEAKLLKRNPFIKKTVDSRLWLDEVILLRFAEEKTKREGKQIAYILIIFIVFLIFAAVSMGSLPYLFP